MDGEIQLDRLQLDSLEMMSQMIASKAYDHGSFRILAEHFAAKIVGEYNAIRDRDINLKNIRVK
jgi:hypothetical protein